MSDHHSQGSRKPSGFRNEPQAGAHGETPVASLIQSYDERRREWLRQANELARMRDEVRGAADHEAMAVITRAREHIRTIIADARRELLVLRAQLDASLGQPAPEALIAEQRFEHGARTVASPQAEAADDPATGVLDQGDGELDGFLAESDEVLDDLRTEPAFDAPAFDAPASDALASDAPNPDAPDPAESDPIEPPPAGAGPREKAAPHLLRRLSPGDRVLGLRLIIVFLVVVIGTVAWARFGGSPEEERAAGPPAVAADGRRVASRSEVAPDDRAIVAAGERWLDTYLRGGANADPAASVTDERLPAERFAPGAPGVRRTLDAIGVRRVGDTALVTARMIERRDASHEGQDGPTEHASRLSQIFTHDGGGWRLAEVRIASERAIAASLR